MSGPFGSKTEAISPRLKQKQGPLSGLRGFRGKERAGQQLLGDDRSAKIVSLVRSAVLGRLTLPCNYRSANRALILLVEPPEEMDRKGVEKARAWIGAARRQGDTVGQLPDQVELHRRGGGARLGRRRPPHPRPAGDGQRDEGGARPAEVRWPDHVEDGIEPLFEKETEKTP